MGLAPRARSTPRNQVPGTPDPRRRRHSHSVSVALASAGHPGNARSFRSARPAGQAQQVAWRRRSGGSRSCWRSRYVTAWPPLSSGGHRLSAWRCGRQAELLWGGVGLPGGARDIRGHDVDGVAVQAGAGPVVPDRGPRVSMRGGFLDVTQRNSRVERGGDERVPQRVGLDSLADPGLSGGLADDPPCAVPVQPPPGRGQDTGPSVRSPMARECSRSSSSTAYL